MGRSAVEVDHKQTFEDDGPDLQPGHVTRFIAARNHASELTVIQDEATACFDVSIPAHLASGHYPVSHARRQVTASSHLPPLFEPMRR